MDKTAEKTISELSRKIETLQAKRDAAIRKEKERKAKAQEKWKALFMREFIKHFAAVFGADYEETLDPEKTGDGMAAYLADYQKSLEDPAVPEKKEEPANAPATGDKDP